MNREPLPGVRRLPYFQTLTPDAAAKYAPGSPYFPLASENIEDFTKFEIGASVETANFDPIVKDLYMATFFKTRYATCAILLIIDEGSNSTRQRLRGLRLSSKANWRGTSVFSTNKNGSGETDPPW